MFYLTKYIKNYKDILLNNLSFYFISLIIFYYYVTMAIVCELSNAATSVINLAESPAILLVSYSSEEINFPLSLITQV